MFSPESVKRFLDLVERYVVAAEITAAASKASSERLSASMDAAAAADLIDEDRNPDNPSNDELEKKTEELRKENEAADAPKEVKPATIDDVAAEIRRLIDSTPATAADMIKATLEKFGVSRASEIESSKLGEFIVALGVE